MSNHRHCNPPRYVRTESFDLQYTLYPMLVKHQRRLLYHAALKADGGILHLSELWHERPSAALMAQRCAQFGQLSRRPYLAGQITDESTSDCVWALYCVYCRSIALDPTALLMRTYPGWETAEKWTESDWSSVLESAQWHGTTLPSVWSTDTVLGLLMSLCGQSRRHLAESLTQEIVLRAGVTSKGALS